jgi:hypothetical protein
MENDSVEMEGVADIFDEGAISMVGSEIDQYDLAPDGTPSEEDLFDTGFVVSRNDLGIVGRSTQGLRDMRKRSQLVLGECGYNVMVYACATAFICGSFTMGFFLT